MNLPYEVALLTDTENVVTCKGRLQTCPYTWDIFTWFVY